ncbi:thiolase family protein [Halobacteriovorax sp. GB3]|uniref:thiolase family protein n=1 Tax=Halobacteriovorax sp. GB3 TaxID=2719615 RepID=UPI00235E419E|nr:thiolase family protein [Halobacteriovorax sp. GB3]MDD0854534.1 thiolase family protein [Halobacteriovorax sp. GB3]
MSLNKGKRVFLIAGKRTPFGKFGGSLKDITPVDLAVYAGKSLLEETGVMADKIDQVILGNVITSSTDTMYGGRHLALKLGCVEKTPGMVVNRLCGSGIQSILDATRLIKLDEANCVLAGGTENMSMTPHLTFGGRFGTKYGGLKSVDMLLDALTDKFSNTPMGITAENLAKKLEVTRDQSDEFSYQSHLKATKAYEDNLLQGELCKIELKRGSCEKDEHIRTDVSLEQMTTLRPSFDKEGVVTPGSASGIVDGAAVVLVASEEFCEKEGITPIAEIVDGHVIGVDPSIMGIGPSPAITELLERNKLSLNSIDLFEINEAFAAQALACVKDLSLPMEKLNVWGGSVAIGHPLAATGTRITTTLARQMKHYDVKMGIASACIGGGQGIALLLKSC